MNSDIQNAGELLTELRNSYRTLPKSIQTSITRVLQEWGCSAADGGASSPENRQYADQAATS